MYKLGQRMVRIAQGNLRDATYNEIKDYIFIITRVEANRIEVEREDGGRFDFSGYSNDYAAKVLKTINPRMRRGGE